MPLSPAHIKSIRDNFDKPIAFIAIASTGTIGVAVKDEQGYNPLPDYWHHDPDYKTLCDYVYELNTDHLKLTTKEAMTIQCSTM